MNDNPYSKELTTYDCCNLEVMKHKELLKETIRESHSFAVNIITIVPSEIIAQ